MILEICALIAVIVAVVAYYRENGGRNANQENRQRAGEQVSKYLRMWPREIFDRADVIGKGKEKQLDEELKQPGVHVLYQGDEPYYVGKAKNMRGRIRTHATSPTSRLYHFWDFFSAFVIEDERLMSQLEGVLIAAMPTANGASPKLPKQAMPRTVLKLLHQIRRAKAQVPARSSIA